MADSQQDDGIVTGGELAEGAEAQLAPRLHVLDALETRLATHASKPSSLSRQELRGQRINELIESCRTQTIAQIIGPFGLTPAMFKDKDGGNVTTTGNFEKGITANEDDDSRYQNWKNAQNSIDRKSYDKDLKEKRKKRFQNDEPIISGATGKELTRDGQTHFDHTKSVASFERDPRSQLYMSGERRVKVLNDDKNIRPMESSINQSMSDEDKIIWANRERKKDPGKTNAESFGVDVMQIEENKRVSDCHIETELRTAQFKKQGSELFHTSINDAKSNALRQAMGVLLHEFANSSYIEIKTIVLSPAPAENLVDRITDALERTARRLIDKMHDAFEALISGGVQGIVSNILTFLINNVITTSAKIVTIIRESMASLWQALKLMWAPPAHLSGMEAAREATKLIAGVITTGLGMYFDTAIKAAIVAIPVLGPIAGMVEPAITAIITGIMTALTVYTVDRIFDWLADPGTEMLNAQIGMLDAQTEVARQMSAFMEQQYANSSRYQSIIIRYHAMAQDLSISEEHLRTTIVAGNAAIEVRSTTISVMRDGLESWEQDGSELSRLISDYKLEE